MEVAASLININVNIDAHRYTVKHNWTKTHIDADVRKHQSIRIR